MTRLSRYRVRSSRTLARVTNPRYLTLPNLDRSRLLGVGDDKEGVDESELCI